MCATLGEASMNDPAVNAAKLLEDDFDPKDYMMGLPEPVASLRGYDLDGGLMYHRVYVRKKFIGHILHDPGRNTWHVVGDLDFPYDQQFDMGPDNVTREYATAMEAAQAAARLRNPI